MITPKAYDVSPRGLGKSSTSERVTARHIATLAFIAVILAIQIGAALVHPNFILWPFLQYDMYSGSAYLGSEHRVIELRVIRGGDEARTRSGSPEGLPLQPPGLWALRGEIITYRDLRIPPYQLKQLLREAQAKPEKEGLALRILEDSIGRWVGEDVSRLQLWERRFRLEPDGLHPVDREMRLVRSWDVDPSRPKPE